MDVQISRSYELLRINFLKICVRYGSFKGSDKTKVN